MNLVIGRFYLHDRIMQHFIGNVVVFDRIVNLKQLN
jgi:hypothetical protein